MRWMGVLFSVFLIIAFGLVFNAVQANSIAGAMNTAFGWDELYVGIAVVLLSAVVIFGGIKRIARVAELIVPVMALLYLVLAIGVMLMNIEKLPDVLVLIFKSAFGLQKLLQVSRLRNRTSYDQRYQAWFVLDEAVWVLHQTRLHQQHLTHHTQHLRVTCRC